MPRLRPLATLLLLLLPGLSGPALADPPDRVGRLAAIEGAVSLKAADQAQWTQGVLNYPVTAGTALWTEDGARAEVQIGPAEVRMGERTEVVFERLDDEAIRLQVPQGAVNIHLHQTLDGVGFAIGTPAGQIALIRAGTYHIEAGPPDSQGAVERLNVAALEGEARFSGRHAMLDIEAGESIVVTPAGYTLGTAQATALDDWALRRERREADQQAVQYLPTGMTGYQDLDAYGRWSTDPAYGPLWVPTAVPAGWAPYRFGHWAYVAPWGWTWIDDAPWGFAPFHYGRWIESPAGWAWCPGRRSAPPVYAPALVAFIGGDGWSVALAATTPAQAVGWVPLGPAEPYRPYYPVSAAYVRQVNGAFGIDAGAAPAMTAGAYANHRGATVVPAAAFLGSAPVHRATLALPPEQMNRAPFAPSVGHLPPNPVARAGQPRPEAATVPAPGTPALVMPPAAVAPSMPARPADRPARPAATVPPQQPVPAHRVTPSAPMPMAAPPAPTATVPAAPSPRPNAPHWQDRDRSPAPAASRALPPMQPQAVERPAQPQRLQATPLGWSRPPAVERHQAPQPQQPRPASQPHAGPHGNAPEEQHR